MVGQYVRLLLVPMPPPDDMLVFVLLDICEPGLSRAEMLLTWIHPLHAVGKGVVGDEIVASRSWVYEDAMGFDEGRQGEREK